MSKIQKKSYNPKKYVNIPKVKISNRIITKGGEDLLKDNLNKITECLDTLKAHENDVIRNLDPSVKDCLDHIIHYVDALYDTDSYQVLHKLIADRFGNVKNVSPGTVSAYFYCSIHNVTAESDIPLKCNPLCVDGMLPPKSDTKVTPCNENVIWGNFVNGAYTFVILNKVPSSTRATLYVNGTTMDSFVGLSDHEKNELTAMGITHARLYGYSPNNPQFKSLTLTYIPISDIKSRKVDPPSTPTDGDPSSLVVSPSCQSPNRSNLSCNLCGNTGTILLIVLLIIIILIIVYFIFKVST